MSIRKSGALILRTAVDLSQIIISRLVILVRILLEFVVVPEPVRWICILPRDAGLAMTEAKTTGTAYWKNRAQKSLRPSLLVTPSHNLIDNLICKLWELFQAELWLSREDSLHVRSQSSESKVMQELIYNSCYPGECVLKMYLIYDVYLFLNFGF